MLQASEMFTGLVQTRGKLVRVRDAASTRHLVIQGELPARDLELGASVAVNGACLTVTQSSADTFTFEAAFETLRKTTLGGLRVGATVNLEPALRMGDALGGHLVSGHVDGIATLRSRTRRGDASEMWFDAPQDLQPFIAQKGSLTLDGVSLTVNEVDARGFMVGIISHTLAVTTLGDLEPASTVNLEVDVLARYVARLLEFGSSPASRLTKDQLAAAGFMSAKESR